jgi:hypothetical protein
MRARLAILLTVISVCAVMPSVVRAHGGPRIAVGIGVPYYPRPFCYLGYRYYAPIYVAPPPVVIARPPIFVPVAPTVVAPPPATLPPTSVPPAPFTPPAAVPEPAPRK